MGSGGSKPKISVIDSNNNPNEKVVIVTFDENGNDAIDNNNKKKDKVEGPILTAEPEIQDVEVAPTEPDYPPLRPPRDKKADIFDLNKMKHIDKHARETPVEKGDSYEELINHLTSICTTDVEKLRAIFVWLGNQDVKKGDYSKVTNTNTPRGYLKLMQARQARIPCIIVDGYGKAVTYEVGDPDEKFKSKNNSWNLVYVANGWRIVFPLWACSGVVGHVSGLYTKVETKGKAVREKEEASEGVSVMHLNEFYFLTDPDILIYVAFPEDPKHQLLPRPWTFKKFCDVPYCRDAYFNENVEIMSKFSCRHITIDGLCTFKLTCEDPKGMGMDYELFYNHKESEKDIPPTLQLNNYVFLERTDTTWSFQIRFPQEGVYKLEITGGRRYDHDLCMFKIFCYESRIDCKPLPMNPGKIGFGPNLETKRAGVNAITHHKGLIRVKPKNKNEFKFELTKAIEVKTRLVHTTISEEQLKQCVTLVRKKNKIYVMVVVPQRGEYALRLDAKQEGQTTTENVCNYLLTSEDTEKKQKKKRPYENPPEKKARSLIQTLSKTTSIKDVLELEKAIQRFEALDLEDKGDLEKAYDVLEFKKVKKDLLDAIQRRYLEILEKAITQANDSRFRDPLQKEIKEAENVRDHLRLAHDVLKMEQPTISELCSYKIPPKVVFDVMFVVLLMLGEKKSSLQDWDDITILMRKTGKDGLLRRVRGFDTKDLSPEVLYHTNRVLTDHNENDVCLASAGAGTFYRWLNNVSKALDDKEEETP